MINTNLPFILHHFQGCKQDLSLRDREETETFGFWSKMRPRPSCNSTRPRRLIFATRRDRNLARPRPRRFATCQTFNLQHCAKTTNGDVQIKNYLYKTVLVSCTCVAINKQTCESVNNIRRLAFKRMYVQLCNEAKSCAYWLVNETLWYETETRPRRLETTS